MSTGTGGKLRSAWTTRRGLTRARTSDDGALVAERWHFPLRDFGGTSSGGGAESASVLGLEATPASQMPWATLAGALGYGFGLYWFVVIEGWPTIHGEARADAIAPAGYDFDPTLVIDRSARLGAVVDGDSHIAKGFDFEMRFLDSTQVRAMMLQPARYTTLTEDLGADDTIAYAKDAFKTFRGLSEFYVGTSCIPCGGIQHNAFLSLDRDAYGERKAYPKGTIVTDGPYTLVGRRVDLHAVLVDPSGRYVQGTSILSKAPVMWSGYIAERPVRDGGEWVVQVRDQVRRIADPVGVAASGSAVWTPDDDGYVAVPTNLVIQAQVALRTTGTILDVRVQPFAGLAANAYASELRAAIVAALTAASTDAHVLSFLWRAKPLVEVDDAQLQDWELVIQFNPDPGDTASELVFSSVTPNGAAGFYGLGSMGYSQPCADTAGVAEMILGVWQRRTVHGVALGVLLDEGDPSQLPATGHIVVEAGGKVDYARYVSVATDSADPMRVNLALDPGDRIFGQDLDQILAGERATASVRFLWSDSGRLADILRRALASTGNAQHGLWDTLPRGQGLALPDVAEDSFDAVFGGLNDLDFQIAVDAGTSIGELFDGLFRLSRRALVTRRREDGGAVEIAAVDIGAVDAVVPVATITEDILVSTQGRRPVRVKSAYTVPQAIKVTCRTIAANDVPEGEGVILLRDPHLLEWTRTLWELDVHGVSRDAIKTLATAWATSWFRAGETRQIVEVDLPPTVTAQVGDVVALELIDASLWDYAGGATGYTGLARVLGAVLAPATAVVTLTLALDGVLSSGPMSPSLQILAIDPGSATAPNWIDVGAEHFDLLAHAQGTATTFLLLAYLPGSDAGNATYRISSVAMNAGLCRLTVRVPPTPAVTLTTSFRLTWPVAAECTDEQDAYLHNTDTVQWS